MDSEPRLRMRFDAFELDEADATLVRDSHPVPLPPKAFAVLCTLARHPGRLVEKNALLDAVWGHRHVSESVLKGTISELRAALADDAKSPRYVETVSRRGYRFIARAADGPAAGSAQPAPMAMADALIGRDVALQRLEAAWSQATSGRRRIVWVTGEPGIGKTTVLDHFVAAHAEALVARGQCVEHFGTSEPYLPVLEALGALCRKDASLVPLMRAVAPTWLLQLPWIASESERAAMRAEVAGSTQDRMLREMGELLERYAQRQPLVLVTEDLHWADDATVRLIDHVARRREPAALLWLASFRPAEIAAADHSLVPVRHELRMHRLCDEIALDPFSEVELARYLERLGRGAAASEAFVQALYRHTDGLPLFVANVLDDMAAQGVALEAMPAHELEVPRDLAGVIEHQLTRLPREDQALLEAASVVGVEFRLDLVADALERDAVDIGARCDELARRQQWIGSAVVAPEADGSLAARYTFRHAIYRHVLYQRTGALARARLHRRVAQSMERLRAKGASVPFSELALHHERGQDLAAALGRYADAAAEALEHFAPREAVRLTIHALPLLDRIPEGPQRLALELALQGSRAVASSHLFGASSPEAQAAFERTHALGEMLPAGRSRAMELSGLGWVYNARGEFDQANALGERLHALAQRSGDALLQAAACGLLGTTMLHQGRLGDARRWLEDGLALFCRIEAGGEGPPGIVDLGVNIGVRLGHALSHLGYPDTARDHIAGAIARSERVRHPFTHMVALVVQGNLEVRLERVEAAAPIAATLDRLMQDSPFAPGVAMSDWLNGWVRTMSGHPREGYERIARAVDYLERSGMLWTCSGMLGHAALALFLDGRVPEAARGLREAFAMAGRIGERLFVPDLHLVEARILGATDPSKQRGAVEAALAEARSQGAAWMELAALTALCQLPGASVQDREALRQVVSSLAEGRDTPLAHRALSILETAPA